MAQQHDDPRSGNLSGNPGPGHQESAADKPRSANDDDYPEQTGNREKTTPNDPGQERAGGQQTLTPD